MTLHELCLLQLQVHGELAINITPPESVPHQLSCTVTNFTATAGLTPSRHKAGMHM